MEGPKRKELPVSEQDQFTQDDTVDSAIRRAAKMALAEHKRFGIPIAVWQDGRVVKVAPEDIPDEIDVAS